jgi:hypothetical protein
MNKSASEPRQADGRLKSFEPNRPLFSWRIGRRFAAGRWAAPARNG